MRFAENIVVSAASALTRIWPRRTAANTCGRTGGLLATQTRNLPTKPATARVEILNGHTTALASRYARHWGDKVARPASGSARHGDRVASAVLLRRCCCSGSSWNLLNDRVVSFHVVQNSEAAPPSTTRRIRQAASYDERCPPRSSSAAALLPTRRDKSAA